METKKMKYYLRKTAVGLAAVSAAFLISSTRVLAEGPTVTDAGSELTLSDAERNLENARTKLSDIDQSLADVNKNIEKAEADKNAAEQKLNESKRTHKEHSDRLAAAENKLRDAYAALNSAGEDQEAKKEANKKLTDALRESAEVSSAWNAIRDRVENEVREFEKEFVAKQGELATLKTRLGELETSKQETEEKIAKLEKEVAAEKEAENLAKHRKDVLEELINLESGNNFVADIKDAAGKAIASASSIQDIDSIMEKAKEDIKNRKEALGNPETEEDLKKAKDAANEVLAALAADVESPEAGRFINDAFDKVDAAGTTSAVTAIVEEAKENVKRIEEESKAKEAIDNKEKEDAQALDTLTEAKNAAYEALTKLATEGDVNPEITRAVNEATDQVEAAVTPETVAAIVEEAKENVERIKEETKAKETVDNKEKEDAQALLNKVKAEAKETLKEAGVDEFYLKKIDSAKTVEGVNALKDLILQSRPKAVPENAPTVDEKPEANVNLIVAKDKAKEILKEAGVGEFYLKKIDSAKTVEGVNALKDLILQSRPKAVPKNAPTVDEKPKANSIERDNSGTTPGKDPKEVKPSEEKGKTLSRVEAKRSGNKKESLPKTGETSSVITTIFGLGAFISSLGLAFPRRRKN